MCAAGWARGGDGAAVLQGLGMREFRYLFSKAVNGIIPNGWNEIVMIQRVEAIYERGVLRPLRPLPLAESQRVSVTVSDSSASRSLADPEFLDAIRAEAAELSDVPSLEEVQRALSKIPGSLAGDFMTEREEH
jgi:predicted DNA-binding antitoxin AbrB/MazE fold protein